MSIYSLAIYITADVYRLQSQYVTVVRDMSGVAVGMSTLSSESREIVQSTLVFMASPDSLFVSTRTCNLEVPGSSPDRAGYLSS